MIQTLIGRMKIYPIKQYNRVILPYLYILENLPICASLPDLKKVRRLQKKVQKL